jgi:hypothetical protein
MARDRWEWLEGLRSTSIEEALAHEAARVLADELLDWPPAIEWDDPRAEAELAPLFQPDAGKPSLAAIGVGFRFARWELEREFEAIDHAVRNDLIGRELTDERDRLAARFLWRWLPEWLLELKERAGPRITRAHLLLALEQAEARVRGHAA